MTVIPLSRYLRTLFALLLVFSFILSPSSALASQPLAQQPIEVPVRPSRAATAAEEDVIKQGYDLLLDRYVQPLNPADLLGAAYTGVVTALTEAGVSVKESSPLLLEPNRERAWTTFRARLTTLLQESPPPANFNVNAVALSAMAKWLDEGHTAYMTPQQYQEFLATQRGDLRFSGIGIRPSRPGVTVVEIFPGSPAEAAGLARGDQIVTVDDQPTEGKTLEQVAVLIRGPEGTPVRLGVLRPRTGEQLQFSIVRASIKIDFINTSMIQDSVAYVRLRGFSEPSVADRFEQFLNGLPSSTRGLVIDLRGNSGGRIDVGLRILNEFIPNGPVWDQIDRSGRHRVQDASGPGLGRALPIAVLIDEGSASMSEIFASAMREHGVARIIGKTSAGIVAGAQAFPLSDGSAMLVTVLEIFSGQGQRLNRVGVEPDEVMETSQEDLQKGRDTPLEAAVLYIWAESDKATALGRAP